MSWPARSSPLLEHWYPVVREEDVRDQPIRREIVGVPVVLYWSAGEIRVFEDRCPHRNVPISAGRCDGRGVIECPYHGWRFDPEGKCLEVPGRLDQQDVAHRLTPLPVRREQGFVWVCPTSDCIPEIEPFRLPTLDSSSTTVVREVEAPAGVHAVAENALDVPHTAILHRGLFRGSGERNRILARTRRFRRWVETEYIGEPPPTGLLARLLAVGGKTVGGKNAPEAAVVRHWDRFFLPGVVQVEYRLGDRSHFLITGLLVPIAPDLTRILAVASFRTPLPGALLARVIEPFALRVFAQDAEILGRQTENVAAFGEERFASTEIDTMGPSIQRLLRAAYRDEQEVREARPPRPASEPDEEPVQVTEVELLA